MDNEYNKEDCPLGQGCGLQQLPINIHVNPTTGGDFYLSVEPDCSVDNFKRLVSKRLKVPRDRICLLFRDKQLQDGGSLLCQHGISDGSKITLLPNVETGLIVQHPEVGIMQALESLNDTQVNEFLGGKAPLNLSMRLGDHMMLIQLQLSTISGSKPPILPSAPPPASSPPSLLQASRNLQHTLRRLSSDVFSNGDKGHRENVYSGTFSGALNPALQDPKGRPRRDVATIVHILNDLLCSVPEFRRVSRKTSYCGVGATSTNYEDAISNTSTQQQQQQQQVELTEVNNKESEIVVKDNEMVTTTTDSLMSPTATNDVQNLRTRGKIEQLRLVMGERRERRRQRKQKPYSLPASNDLDSITA